jgi:RNA polymerase sigma-70 factor (ECF subfamily)
MEQAAASYLIMPVEMSVATRAEEFEALVRSYRQKIFRFALVSLRDRDVAETITQDCFLKAYRAWEHFRNDCSVQTWLMQIAVNLVRDHARNRRLQFWRRARTLDGVSQWLSNGEASPETQSLRNEQVKAIWEAAAHLPERQRTVFLLRFVEDMDLLEIAFATGMKEGTVKTHLFRSLRAVRERIGAPA